MFDKIIFSLMILFFKYGPSYSSFCYPMLVKMLKSWWWWWWCLIFFMMMMIYLLFNIALTILQSCHDMHGARLKCLLLDKCRLMLSLYYCYTDTQFGRYILYTTWSHYTDTEPTNRGQWQVKPLSNIWAHIRYEPTVVRDSGLQG